MEPPVPATQTEYEAKLLRLAEVAYHALWSASLFGHQTTAGRNLHQRIEHPQIGDLVLEVTTAWREGMGEWSDGNRLGYLQKIEHEYAEPEVDLALPEGERAGKTKVWYILTLDGREVRWHNCKFAACPTSPSQRYEWEEGHW